MKDNLSTLADIETQARLEEVTFLREQGVAEHRIAEQLGMKLSGYDQFLGRHGLRLPREPE